MWPSALVATSEHDRYVFKSFLELESHVSSLVAMDLIYASLGEAEREKEREGDG